jgi:hypothetical protein
MTSGTFSGTIAETFDSIERALARIEEWEAGDTGLHHLRADLLSLLELVERDSGIEAAVDDLYASASRFVAARQQGAEEGDAQPDRRGVRLLREARLRLSQRLDGAIPNAHAKRLGLS